MSGDALFATAPYDEGAGCGCCGSREHATNGCPTGVAADLWTGHEETHEGPALQGGAWWGKRWPA